MQALEYMQKISLKNRKIFGKAYAKLQFPLAEHSFSWIYLWQDCYKDIEWAEINGNLCLFITFEGGRHLWGPPLPGKKLADTIKKCFSLCENYSANNGLSKRPDAMYIPEELTGEYWKLEGFKLEEQDRDYIYKTSDIKGLKGKKLKDKRNKRNFFARNYKHAAEDYSAKKHRRGCEELLERWQEQKSRAVDSKDRDKLKADVAANKRCLEAAEKLGLKGMAVLVEGKVEGYIFGEQTSSRLCTLFFGKTDLEIKGLSQFIYSEFLKKSFGRCELVNDGEDWGVDYLAKSKSSYRPLMTRKSYTLVENGRI